MEVEKEEDDDPQKCTKCENTSEEYEIKNCAGCLKNFCSDCNDACCACGDTMCRKCQEKESKQIFWCDWCSTFRCPFCAPYDGPFIKTCQNCDLQYCATTCWKIVTCKECNKSVGCRSCWSNQKSQCLLCYMAEWTARDFQNGLHPDFFSPQCPQEVFNLIRTYIHT